MATQFTATFLIPYMAKTLYSCHTHTTTIKFATHPHYTCHSPYTSQAVLVVQLAPITHG